MRLSLNSVRYNGVKTSYTVTNDGLTLSVPLAPLAARALGTLTYLLEVRPDAPAGQTMNRAQATDNHGTTSAIADAAVRIARDGISDRLTIIGRLTDGGCQVDPDAANGVTGVRVMLEDGSYAVTDVDGRYHFEGVVPGTHVVQIDPSTLGPNLVPAECAANARSAGSSISRFVTGQGGALLRADFRVKSGLNTALPLGKAVRFFVRAGLLGDPGIEPRAENSIGNGLQGGATGQTDRRPGFGDGFAQNIEHQAQTAWQRAPVGRLRP